MNKYRAWDVKDKVMRNWEDLIMEKEEGNNFWLIGYKENIAITSYDHEQILMQSTGLVDKNGVEIFEGDILRYNKNKGDKHEQGEVCEVVWRSDGCWSVGQLRFAQINSMEVLGNIYENADLFDNDSIYGNPELLKEVE